MKNALQQALSLEELKTILKPFLGAPIEKKILDYISARDKKILEAVREEFLNNSSVNFLESITKALEI